MIKIKRHELDTIVMRTRTAKDGTVWYEGDPATSTLLTETDAELCLEPRLTLPPGSDLQFAGGGRCKTYTPRNVDGRDGGEPVPLDFRLEQRQGGQLTKTTVVGWMTNQDPPGDRKRKSKVVDVEYR